MGDFERRVLRLVSEGKLTAEEGEELLRSHERGSLRDLRSVVEESLSGVGRVVREHTEPDVQELLRAELPASDEPLELRIAGDFGLALLPGDDGACRAVWSVGKPFFGEVPLPPEVRLDGRTLRVEGRARYGFGLGLPFGGYALDIYLPPGTRLAGSIAQRLGRVRVDDLPLEDMHLDTQNGRVQVEVPRLKDLQVTSRNGSIEVAAKEGGKVRVDAYNGRVALRGALQDVEAMTRNGRIEADLRPVQNGRCRLETLNGAVELELANGIACDLRAETVHGPISVDMPGLSIEEDVRDFSRRRLHGRTTGSEGDLVADLGTTNGAVRVLQHGR